MAMITALTVALSLMTAPPPCRFAGETRAWTMGALQAWDRLDAERLRIARPTTPVITLFDSRCAYTLTPDRRGDFRVGQRRYRSSAAPHDGAVALPDGNTVPAQHIAFASPISDGRMFFIMALPELWRDNARDTRLLAMVVFMHEFAHTQQADGLGARVDDLLARGLPEDANDDVVQDQFAERPGYEAEYATERDAYYAAAQASDQETARSRLAEARRLTEARRGRWFRGSDALYAEADDLFLTMEGTGNWAAWAWLTDPRGGRLSRSDAVAFVRGAGRQWSQDQGLAMMLAVDRLTPDWPSRAFGTRPATADELVARAIAR